MKKIKDEPVENNEEEKKTLKKRIPFLIGFKFWGSVLLSETVTLLVYGIICLIIFFISFILAYVFKMKDFNFSMIFWGVVALIFAAAIEYGFNNASESEGIHAAICPKYIPFVNMKGKLKYPSEEISAEVPVFLDEACDEYWETAAKYKRKTSIYWFYLIVLAIFGTIIVLSALTLAEYAREWQLIVDAFQKYNKANDMAYNFASVNTSIYKEVLEWNGLPYYDWSEIAIKTRPFAAIISFCAVTIINRFIYFIKYSCIKCGNAGLFKKYDSHYSSGNYDLQSSESVEQQIGTISAKVNMFEHKDVATVYVNRKDHYTTNVNAYSSKYDCACPFCNKGKRIKQDSRFYRDKTYTGSSY